MSFDLIIANPPYGSQNSLVKKILRKILPFGKEIVCLAPIASFLEDDIFPKCGTIKKVENVFEDASMHKPAVASLRNENNNTTDKTIYLLTNERQIQLFKGVDAYNKSHKRTYEIISYFNCKENEIVSKTKLYDGIVPFRNETFRDIWENENAFVYGHRSAGDGVHGSDAEDYKCNVERNGNAFIKPHQQYFDSFIFSTKVEKDNYKEWWYSCTKSWSGKKQGNGLTNAFLSLINECVSGGAGVEAYKTYFPNLDWSHPWTDQEILKEIGLPEDFLEKG